MLLASGPSLEMILKAVNKFYFSTSKTLEAEEGVINSWLVIGEDGVPQLGVRVRKRGARYRFEMVL